MNRNKSKSLENIANGFRAAYKIQTLQSSSYRSDNSTSSGILQPGLMRDVLHVLAEFSPEGLRDNLSSSLERSTLYADTYKNAKQHLINSRSHRMKGDDIIGLIQIVQPVMEGKSRHNIEKILKIYEILKS